MNEPTKSQTSQGQETRGQEHEIRIDASAEDLWRAITDSQEVTRWYVHDAKIEPRVGGSYWISWGEGMDGESEITAFEPGRRLQISHKPTEEQPALPTGPMIEEFLIETDGGQTVLRLVTSGIPATEDWDWFYEGTKRGWRIFLMTLRHYLERHRGTPRDHIVTMVALPGSCEEAWPLLTGPAGIGIDAFESVEVGGRFTAHAASGSRLSGDVLLLNPPYRFLATVDELNDALLGVTLEQMGPQNSLYLSLSTFGLPSEKVEALRGEWSDLVAGLFPQMSGSSGPVEASVDTSMAGEAPNG